MHRIGIPIVPHIEKVYELGMTVTVRDSYAAAVTVLEEAPSTGTPYPLVLVDSRLADANGFDLAGWIHNHPQIHTRVVMMLTSDDQNMDIAHCQDLAVSAYLIKPIRKSALQAVLLRALQNHPPISSPFHGQITGQKAGMAREMWQSTSVSRPNRSPAARVQVAEGSAQGSYFDSLGPTGLRILVVEDNLVNQKVASLLLQARGHQVESVVDGREALDMLERHTFDVVLMDVEMPGINGLDTTAIVRER